MAIVGGSLRECSINNRVFQCPADAAVKIMLGGFSNEIAPTGSGKSIMQKTRVTSGIEGLVVAIDANNDDLRFLQDIADGAEFVPVTVTLADGNTYSGSQQITEPPAHDTQKATCELKLAGEDTIERQ